VRRVFVRLAMCVLPAAWWAGPATAHEFWLEPSVFRAGAGDTVRAGVVVGTGFRGESVPWAAPRAIRFTLDGPRRVSLMPGPIGGETEWLRFALEDGGGALIAYESNAAHIEMSGEEFEAYLRTEGLEGPLEARRLAKNTGPARENYARCPKTWIAGTQPARALRAVGQTLEIVPLSDPVVAHPLRVRVIEHGHALAGALVRAWLQPLVAGGHQRSVAERDSVGPACAVRTGPDGVATLPLSGAGEWLLSCVQMRAARDSRVADWESIWASFTFSRAR
jgi:uncharacterized GH25 family protein